MDEVRGFYSIAGVWDGGGGNLGGSNYMYYATGPIHTITQSLKLTDSHMALWAYGLYSLVFLVNLVSSYMYHYLHWNPLSKTKREREESLKRCPLAQYCTTWCAQHITSQQFNLSIPHRENKGPPWVMSCWLITRLSCWSQGRHLHVSASTASTPSHSVHSWLFLMEDKTKLTLQGKTLNKWQISVPNWSVIHRPHCTDVCIHIHVGTTMSTNRECMWDNTFIKHSYGF